MTRDDSIECKVAALALFESFWKEAPDDTAAIVGTTAPAELITGLVGLLSSALARLARIYDLEMGDMIVHYRSALQVEQARH